MKKKTKLDLSILENGDEQTVEILSERYKVSDEKEKERIFQQSINRCSTEEFSDIAESVKGVEPYRRRGWFSRKVTAIVCMLSVSVITVGAIMLNSFRKTPHEFTSSSESTETTINSTISDNETEATEYDMSTKQGVLFRMLDSIYFYDRASGELIQSSNAISCNIVEFETDLETAESYSHIRQCWLYNPYEVIEGAKEEAELITDEYGTYDFINYSDGTHLKTQNLLSGKTSYLSSAINRDIQEGFNSVREIYSGGEIFIEAENKPSPTNCPYADDCLFPQRLVFSYLSDMDLWELEGSESYLGRECIVVSGRTVDEEDITDFTIYADKETGVVLKFIACNDKGELSQFLIVREIKFDNDSDDVRKVDEDEEEIQ